MAVKAPPILAAVGLSAVTLWVFYTSVQVRPEATLRRFIAAVLNDRPEGVAATLVDPVQSPQATYLINMARQLGLGYQVQESRIIDDRLILVTTYESPDRPPIAIGWVLVQVDGKWKVDATNTLRISQAM